MAVALILLLVAVASVLFHLFSPWWWTPIASNWSYIDHTITLTFWITGAVFSAIVAFMAYCVFRFRHTEGRRAAYNPENKKLEWWLSIGTAIGVAAMLAPGLVVWHQFVTVPADATEVEVMGQQWLWSYRLPGKDGRLGTSDARRVSSDNPMGLNPDDPAGSSAYHHARHDHGDLSSHRAVSGRFRKLPHPADGRRAGHGFPLCQHAELLGVCTKNPVRVY